MSNAKVPNHIFLLILKICFHNFSRMFWVTHVLCVDTGRSSETAKGHTGG
eukprot:TRINITY_DN14314_c0_g1_i1.p2 TRINITY_DN14314_c0_g1~~TRINITY_DN14314_c0_g1_i1.p2  ORF type:complete len:50 (+),score=6.35 TRINITY_DN14314_c0_g1_i1:137-286(+)